MRFRLRPVLFRFATRHSARAGLVAPAKPNADSVLDYPWSSISQGYAPAPKKRPEWLSADAGLELFGFTDIARNRRRFIERLDARMLAEEAKRCGSAEIEDQTLNSSLRRGWYWGSEVFKDEMLHKLEAMSAARRKQGSDLPSSHNYAQGSQFKDHHLRLGEAIIRRGINYFGLSIDSDDQGPIPKMPRGNLSAVAIAWSICRYKALDCGAAQTRLGR